MANPYFCYAVGFSISILLYLLGWSELYPPLSGVLLCFLCLTVIAHVLLGNQLVKKHTVIFYKLEALTGSGPLYTTAFIYVLWAAEFIYNKGIPLILILSRQFYDYKSFGIPHLHVFIVTFSSFYTIFLFHKFLSTKSRVVLALYLINLLAAFLIYNRGMLFFNLSASACLFIMYKKTLSRRYIAMAGIAVVLLFYLFGVLGSLRVTNESRKTYSSSEFLNKGRASASFKESMIPADFFWSYFYITSPLANLQTNINLSSTHKVTFRRVGEWFNNEILFDFASKRINSVAGIRREDETTISRPFNASTIYSRSFSYLGWPGVILMSVVVMLIPGLYLKILTTSSPFFLTGIALLNTVFLFMIFDNTLRFTGLSFQLLYPIFITGIIRYIPWLKSFFE